jgi:hypothetical protein
MTISISTEKVGQRIYVTGNTYSIRDQLKAAGCHWDGDRRQWWIGVAKAQAIAAIVGQLDGQEAQEETIGDDTRVYARVEYKGRSYYQISRTKDGARLRLTTLDAKLDFWADAAACHVLKEYQPRQVWDGRRYSGRTIARHQTLGALREFLADKKAAEKGECPRCQAREAAGRQRPYSGHGDYDYCAVCGNIYGEV